MIALESHIERPGESTIFSRYPNIMKDHFAVDFICDTLRMMTMNLEDPHQVEDAMENQLEKHHNEAIAPSGALQDHGRRPSGPWHRGGGAGRHHHHGLHHRAARRAGLTHWRSARGHFLGVFLAYGMVGPMATRMKAVVEEEASFYKIIQAVLVAHLHGNAAQISVEIGRGNVPSTAQPSFLELEETLGAIPNEP